MANRSKSLRLARVGGVDIFIHVSWLFIAGLVLLGFWGQIETDHPDFGGIQAFALALFGAIVFFGSVLIHEMAHAFMARRRGIDVKGITLYLFGGATEADASSRSPADEFVVAIVGPLTSFALAGLLALAGLGTGGLADPIPEMLNYLALLNVILGLFNLAPGLPLDGGRVFRSIAWAVTGDFARATRMATATGVAVGYLLMTVGFVMMWQGNFGGLWLVFIGWLITQSARQNELQESIRSMFTDLTAADVMSSPVITIPADTTVADAVRDYFVPHNLTTFPVVDDGEVLGLLTVPAVRAVPANEIWRVTAGQLARDHQPVLEAAPETPMVDVIEALASGNDAKTRVLTLDEGRLVGIISPSDVLRRRALADLTQLTTSPPPPPPPPAAPGTDHPEPAGRS